MQFSHERGVFFFSAPFLSLPAVFPMFPASEKPDPSAVDLKRFLFLRLARINPLLLFSHSET